MLQPKELLLMFLVMILTISSYALEIPARIIVDDSIVKGITQDENILYNMINDMRIQNKLPSIPLSPNLSIVAHTHIVDLTISRPQDKGCSLHSWSESGKWTACCNFKSTSGIQCMRSKPREITGYPGYGYELIYWGEEKATPTDAAALWQQVDASSDMILCRGKWKGYQWKALGVGISGGYAILWLGDKTDKKALDNVTKNSPLVQQAGEKEAVVSKKRQKVKNIIKADTAIIQKEPEVSGQINTQPVSGSGITYYLIVASVKSAAAAKSELKRVKSKGYPDAFILQGDVVYRVALKSCNTARKAAIESKELNSHFPGIWILKK